MKDCNDYCEVHEFVNHLKKQRYEQDTPYREATAEVIDVLAKRGLTVNEARNVLCRVEEHFNHQKVVACLAGDALPSAVDFSNSHGIDKHQE